MRDQIIKNRGTKADLDFSRKINIQELPTFLTACGSLKSKITELFWGWFPLDWVEHP